jgi:hypothetical protein
MNLVLKVLSSLLLVLLLPKLVYAHAPTPGDPTHSHADGDATNDEFLAHIKEDLEFEGVEQLHAKLLEAYDRFDFDAPDQVVDFTISEERNRSAYAQNQDGAEYIYGAWSPVYDWPLVGIFNTLLRNGKVLAWDNVGDNPADTYRAHDRTRATVWDPATNTHSRVDLIGENIFCAGFANLPDGTVFTAGGNLNARLEGLRSTYTFNPNSYIWTRGASMTLGRWYPSVTPLANGEMLISGGGPGFYEVRKTDGGLRTLTSARTEMPYYPWMQVAPDGRVFYAGPTERMLWLSTIEAGAITQAGTRDDVSRNYGSYVMYDIGKILVAGGGASVKSSYLIDINTSAASAQMNTPMNLGRRQHNLTVLADGSVLATGGNSSGADLVDLNASVYSAELWSPLTRAWTTMSRMSRPRQYHSTAMLLPDARVLVTGGGICGECQQVGYLEKNAEIYSPPYLFAKDGSGNLAARPRYEFINAPLFYKQTFDIVTAQARSVQKVALVRSSSVTHSVNQEQRYVPLRFVATDDALTVEAPDNANIAPPGYYMLFIIDANGVPSMAQMVNVKAASPIDASLVGNWRFDEATGIIASDASGYNNGGQLLNGTGRDKGVVENALSLKGSNNAYVRIPRSKSLDSVNTQVTAMAWAYPNVSINAFLPLITRQVGGKIHPDQYFLGFGNGQYKWHVSTGVGGTNEASCYWGAMPSGQWVHVAGTYDGSRIRLYINGSEVCSQLLSGAIATDANPVTIGAEENGENHDPQGEFNGRIDEVRLYNRALHAHEIANYVRSINPAPPTPAPNTPTPPPSTPSPTPTVSGVCSVNLLNNPSYENGTDAWEGNYSLSSQSQHGNAAAKIEQTLEGVAQIVAAQPTHSYDLSVWGKIETGSPVATIGLSFYRSDYTTTGPQYTLSRITSTYYQQRLSGVAPADAAYVGVWAYNTGGGAFVVDNWCLQQNNTRQNPSTPNETPHGFKLFLQVLRGR